MAEISSDNGRKFTIPIGPQHPALKEPGHFEFVVDGEVIQEASVKLGYAHRGIEKIVEDRNYTQAMYILERVCGICSHVHASALAMGAEQLAGVEAPPRARAIRTLVYELERIHSHLLWLGVAAHEAGFEALFMYSWRDRETIMDILEEISGSRVHYSVNAIGGVRIDISAESAQNILKAVDFLEERSKHYLNVVSSDRVFLQRSRGIGVMSPEEGNRWGVVGPVARASGIKRDVRVDAPYAAYDIFPVTMITASEGDLEARFTVRVRELLESTRLVREVVKNLPEGELTTKVKRKIPPAETVVRIEAPRGELMYYMKSNGTDQPERIHGRTPTIPNMASVLHLTIGHQLADAPMILAGIDPCFSCNDRAVVLKSQSHSDLWSWDQLRQYGIDRYHGRT
ncbi:MAG: NADH dehydrogenase subunit [Chloroflexi bacterium]|nr:NADH dehydrogenase subunit [Chloroflexota bacterium]